ncbi:MAG: peroxiredoxin [Maricaulaceae bacterium]|jgi:peroxiredoxin
MAIAVGDKLPESALQIIGPNGAEPKSTGDVFAGRKVALFAVPGAFTPTCSAKHLPGFVQQADAIKAKGVDDIICVSVNDSFVMDAWGKAQGADGKVTMAADGDGAFAKALGLDMDTKAFGGVRSKRYSMLINDGVVEKLNVEEGGGFEVSDAETLLGQL